MHGLSSLIDFATVGTLGRDSHRLSPWRGERGAGVAPRRTKCAISATDLRSGSVELAVRSSSAPDHRQWRFEVGRRGDDERLLHLGADARDDPGTEDDLDEFLS